MLGDIGKPIVVGFEATGNYHRTLVPDAAGCDAAVTDFRLRSDGGFAGGRSISIRVRYLVE